MAIKDSIRRPMLLSILVSGSLPLQQLTMGADQAPKMKYEMPLPKDAFFSPLGTKVEAENNELYHLLLDREMIMDPQQRKARLQVVKPLQLKFAADFKELGAAFPSMQIPQNQRQVDAVQDLTTERLALLGDEDAMKQLQTDATGQDPIKAGKANAVLAQNSWTMADGEPAKEAAIADSLEKLDKAYPKSDALTTITFKLSNEAGSRQLHERLMDLAIGMDNPAAKSLGKMKKIRDAAKETTSNVGKPFVLTGKTPEGKDFTTADWKGKVILVDFWATWCGPCKQELPNIEKLYADYHDKGFEIVGVSNDFDLSALAKYTAANNMPWPQLIDIGAAEKRTWNPTTLSYGIDSIPRVFVIDRNGILLDNNARETYEGIVKKALAQK